ncbi:unnamed protein product [Lepidochelys kempii]
MVSFVDFSVTTIVHSERGRAHGNGWIVLDETAQIQHSMIFSSATQLKGGKVVCSVVSALVPGY